MGATTNFTCLLFFSPCHSADERDVVREAMRVLERQEFYESPALEAAILEGVASPHQPYDTSVMDLIRRNARSIAWVWKYRLPCGLSKT